jgi:cell division protein FtsB
MPHKAIIIETTANILTALEVTGGPGGPEINRWASCALPPEGLTPAVVREFWRKEKFATTRAIWLLPERLVRYRTLTFMSLPEEQLTAAIKLEMDGCSAKDELWRVIGSRQQDGQVLVRVAVLGNRQLTQELEVFSQAGLAISWSGLYSHGLQNFILFHRDLYETEPERFVYLYLTADRTEYGVVTEETISYRREIAVGSDALAQAESEDNWDDFVEELRLSFASSKTSGQQKTDVLWLFGVDVAVLAKLQKELTQAGLTVVLPARTNFRGVLTRTQTPRLAPLVGLALDELGWNRIENFRFHTLEQRNRRMIRQNCRRLLQWGIVAAFLLLGGWLAFRAQLEENQAKRLWLASQQAKLAQLRRIETLTQVNLKKLTELERWSSGKGQELEFLLALQKQLPPKTVITDLTIEAGKVKNLAGTTPLVSLLLTRLANDPRLRMLELKGNIMTTATGRESFQLEEPEISKEQKIK